MFRPVTFGDKTWKPHVDGLRHDLSPGMWELRWTAKKYPGITKVRRVASSSRGTECNDHYIIGYVTGKYFGEYERDVTRFDTVKAAKAATI